MSDLVVRLLQEEASHFVLKAKHNIEKWGDQDYETLALAVAEEAGELAQAVLQHRYEGEPTSRIYEEAHDLGALCLQVTRLYYRKAPS